MFRELPEVTQLVSGGTRVPVGTNAFGSCAGVSLSALGPPGHFSTECVARGPALRLLPPVL